MTKYETFKKQQKRLWIIFTILHFTFIAIFMITWSIYPVIAFVLNLGINFYLNGKNEKNFRDEGEERET